MILLARSWMWGQFCVAGIELDCDGNLGNWIRLVYSTDEPAIPARTMQYSDGHDPELLDIVEVPVLEHRPENHQQENWLLSKGIQWKKISTFQRSRLVEITDTEGTLWQAEVEKKGWVSREVAKVQGHSLKLINAKDFVIHWKRTTRWNEVYGCETTKTTYIAEFDYSKKRHHVVVTDPKFENVDACSVPMDNVYLTISLTKQCCMLVAAVLEP